MLRDNPESLELIDVRKIKFLDEYCGHGPATLCELSFLANGCDIQKAYFGMVISAQFAKGDTFIAMITQLPGTICFYMPPPPLQPRTPKQLESAKIRMAESKVKRHTKAVAASLVMEVCTVNLNTTKHNCCF